MKRNIRLATGLALASVLDLSGCNPDPKDTKVIARIKSPDDKLEAIYTVDTGGGAAVGTTEEVFVVEKGAFPRLVERVFSKECANELALTWEAPRSLRIKYTMASDIREAPEQTTPSPFSVLSSAYWTYAHPHGTKIRIVRVPAAPGSGC